MELQEMKEIVEGRLPKGRFDHVLRVVDTAKLLAETYDVSKEQAEIAALLHDVAKAMPKEQLRAYIQASEIDQQILQFHHELWHAPVGAILAQSQFGIQNEDVLDAIFYHTTGRANMSPLEMVVYVADMIEPGRSFPGVENLRKAAENSLQEALRACIGHSVQYLVEQRVPIYPLSFECYNYYLQH